MQIIDMRSEDEFLHGHIPGSRNIWRSDIQDSRAGVMGMRIGKEELKQLMRRFGIDHNDSLYIYDAKGNVEAARLWWLLNLYGYHKTALIDGGYTQWLVNGYKISSGPEFFDRSKFIFEGPEQPEMLAFKKDVMARKSDYLLDNRSEGEYTGKIMKNGAIRGGHIPGAIRLDYFDFMNGGQHTIKSKEEILGLLAQHRVSTEKSIINYCHSGVRSAYVTFVLREIVGMKNVSNYDGSWIEWSDDERLEIVSDLHK